MRPLPFVWPYALIFWGIHIWAFVPEFRIINKARTNLKSADSRDRGSIGVIMALTWVALLVAYPVAFSPFGSVGQNLRIPFFVVGVTLMLLGSLLRRMCFRALGEYFTGDVQARANQPVICTGPYRLVRHPSYTAGIMMFVGIGFALGNWLSVLLLGSATIGAYLYRISIEERVLAETIGAPYVEYMQKRKRFIPYVV